MDLSIIIVDYNSIKDTLECIESIKKSDLEGIDFEIIVVNNNPKNDIAHQLLRKYPEVSLIRAEKNKGMGGGNNVGINNAQGEIILILNPDIRVKYDSIILLYRYIINNDNAGIVGPKLLNIDGSLQYSCLRFPEVLTPIFRRTSLGKVFKEKNDSFLMKDFDHEDIRDVDWLTGSCLMIRKTDKLRFDKRYFMYFEDIDFCKTAKKNNLKVVYNPQSVVIHEHKRESAKKTWYIAPFRSSLAREHIKSWIKYFLKWGIK